MRKKVLLAIGSVLLLVSTTAADPGDTLWTRTYGGSSNDWGECLRQTSDGGYIVAGGASSFGAGGYDVWLLKTDSSGDTLWTHTYGGSSDDRGYSVQETSDGGFIIAGQTESFGAGESDLYLVKSNSSGDTLWTRAYGADSSDYGYSVQQTSDSGYIVAGATSSFGAGSYDVYLLKTDSSGDTLWTRTYGGSGWDWGESVQQTSDSGYIIAGVTGSFGAGAYDVWLVKTNSSGDTLWTHTYGGGNNDNGYSVQQTSDSGYIVAGVTGSFGAGGYDVWLLKTDASGDTLWSRTYGGSSNDYGYSVQQTPDGGYVIAGYSLSFGAGAEDVWLLKTDASGDTLWSRTYGGSSNDYGKSVQRTSAGGYIIAGQTWSSGAGYNDVYLVCVTGDGSVVESDGESKNPVGFSLSQNYPNPFNAMTVIEYEVPAGGQATLAVYNLVGQRLATLVEKRQQPGYRSIIWDASDFSSGVYFYRLTAGDFTEARRMILVK